MKLQHLLSEMMTDDEWEKHQQAVRDIDNFLMKEYGLEEYTFTVVKVGNDLKVNVNKDVTVPRARTSLGVMFNQVGGNFSLTSGSVLESLEGVPQIIGGHAYLDSKHLTSLAGLENAWIAEVLDLTESGVKTLSGIHKTHKRMKAGEIHITEDVTNILGLASIPGIEGVTISGMPPKWFDLTHHDVHEFQEQLLDAGFKAQARL